MKSLSATFIKVPIMSKNIWITSDTHFNHANILNFTDSKTGNRIRPQFSCVQEMNETIIQRWNEVVRPGDKVYHLGDVVMGTDKETWMNRHWPRLMGKKNLIVGNHDDIKSLSSGGWFAKVQMWRVLPEFGLTLTHVPIHDSGLFRGAESGNQMLNVHGHIHQNPSPKGPYRNVSVEVTNYYPINIEDLRIK
jgi:calcineurin-like phosphoesterase family protein